MKKGVVVFFVLEVLSLFIFVSVSATEINSCGNYSAGTYELNVSIDTSLDTCFTFGSGNFILDCQGNYVNNTSPYLFDDFVSFSGTNVTIKNCVIIGYGLQQNSGIQTFLVYNTTFINGGDIILDDVVNVFDNVSFYNDSGGNAFQFRKSLINNSLFVNLTRAFSATGGVGLKFYNTNFSNITTGNLFLNSGMIFDNVFFNNVSGSSTYYIGGNAISNIIITRSTFKDMESIYFFTGYSYNISISNSVFNNTDLKGLLNYSFIDNSSFDNNANAYGFSIDAFNTAMNNLTIRNFNETFEITGNNLTLFGFNFSYNYNLGAELLSINTNNSLFNNFSLLNTSLFLKGGNNTYNNFSVYSGGILSPKGLNDSSFLSGEILNGGKLQSNFDGSAIKNVNLSFKNFYCYNSTCLYLKYLDNSSINENIVNCTNTYAITIENSNYNRIYNNTILGSLSNGSLCYSGSHGILITNSSSENRGYNNSITNVSYGYLFEWNSNRNSFYDNYQYGSSVIFYDLHDNRNNEAYNNYIEGNVKILDNVSGESFYNNTVLGDIQFFGDGVLGDGTGATNITLKNMVVQGNIILQNYSTNIIFINVTYDSSNEFIDENSTLSRKWYLDASTNVAGTNINIVNYSGVSVYSGVVSSSIPQQTFLSYENVGGGGRTYYSNYTMTASASGHITNTTNINLTSNFNLSFYLVSSPIETPTTNSDLDSGSGTGTFRPSQNNLANGYAVKIKETQKVEIPIGDSGNKKQIIVESVNDEEIIVSANGENYNVNSDSSAKIDLDSDGYYDVEVSINGKTINGYANLEFKLINEEVPKTNEEEQNENILDEIPEIVKKISGWKIYVLIGIIVFLIIIWFLLDKKIKSKRRYRMYGY